jgi:recombination protein RecA
LRHRSSRSSSTLCSKTGEILDLGVKAGIVEKSGAWFSFDSIRIGQGRENSKTWLKENPDMADKLEKLIRGRTEAVAEEMMVGPDADTSSEAESDL